MSSPQISSRGFTRVPPRATASTVGQHDKNRLVLSEDTNTHSSSADTNKVRRANRAANVRQWSEHHTRNIAKAGQYEKLHGAEKSPGSSFRGWRKAVIAAAAVASFVLLVNTVLTIVALSRFEVDDGVGIIYKGDCDLVKRWDTAIHLVINVLGTALLAASSFTMQCLSSPTRSEVDIAHAKRVSLDIGISSFINLFHVKAWKTALWVLLCLSTLPLHLLWNSTVFSTTGINLFTMVVAEQSFLDGATYQQPSGGADVEWLCGRSRVNLSDVIANVYDGYKEGRYSDLSVRECYEEYSAPILTTRGNLIVIVEAPESPARMSACGYKDATWNGSSVVGVNVDLRSGPAWPSFFGNTFYEVFDDYYSKQVHSSNTFEVGHFRVASCKSEVVKNSQCLLQFTSYILYVVVACNLVKCVCMCLTARYLWSLTEPILATVGDAVASFLENPDESTKGFCLIDFHDIERGVWTRLKDDQKAYSPAYNRRPKRRLYSATSDIRWWSTMSLCTAYLIVGFVLWKLSLDDLSEYSFQESMKMKFGAVDSGNLLGVSGASGLSLLRNIIIANSFQLALSIVYFLYNSLYTAQYAALEWAGYVQGKMKSLRVTWPRGLQRSTYYLQLPYRYGIPLALLLMLMHFLISQSIFLARIRVYDMEGKPDETQSFTDVGFSPRAILTACIIGALMLLAQILHACRPLDNRIPLHGNSSLVLSALCHPEQQESERTACNSYEVSESNVGKNEKLGSSLSRYQSAPNETTDINDSDKTLASSLLTWGVTRRPQQVDGSLASAFLGGCETEQDGAGHCTFSSEILDLPQKGLKYR